MLLNVNSVRVRHKIFLSAIEYLPFAPGDHLKGSFEEIVERLTYLFQLLVFIEADRIQACFHQNINSAFIFIYVHRVLARSREIKIFKYDKLSDVAEQCRLQSLQKAMVIQWLCFTPPSTIKDAKVVSSKLLLRALMHR